jgi:hypothetical protein
VLKQSAHIFQHKISHTYVIKFAKPSFYYFIHYQLSSTHYANRREQLDTFKIIKQRGSKTYACIVSMQEKRVREYLQIKKKNQLTSFIIKVKQNIAKY